MGEALSCALAMEEARWSDIQFSGVDDKDLFEVSAEALRWTNGVMRHL